VVAWIGFGRGDMAPGITEPGTAPYKVTHNLIRSHTSAYRMYGREFRAKQRGRL